MIDREKVIQAIRDEPEVPYWKLAERFKCSLSTIALIARQSGSRRRLQFSRTGDATDCGRSHDELMEAWMDFDTKSAAQAIVREVQQ